MQFTPPATEQILNAFKELKGIDEHRRGGFKVVYRGRTDSGVEAFKLLCLPKVDPKADDHDIQEGIRREHLGRARREVELLDKIEIPEFVKLGSIAARIEAIDGTDYLGYSEEWLDGGSLWDVIRNPAAPLPSESECVLLLLSLTRAIQALWALDSVHRDIKPQNVMRLNDPQRRFVLLDLGIAYDVAAPGLTYNSAGAPATLRYLAPEMADANFREHLDFRSDLYAAGLTVFEYAAKRHPIARDADDTVKTVARALNEVPPSLASWRPDFSAETCAIVDQLLRKRPILRPGNLTVLLRRINALQK